MHVRHIPSSSPHQPDASRQPPSRREHTHHRHLGAIGVVRIRMTRMGRHKRPFYRINAIEKRRQRDGEVLERLGWYDPMASDASKQVELNADRIKHWITQGAQPSDTTLDLLLKHGIVDAAYYEKQRGHILKNRKDIKLGEMAAAKTAKEAEEKAKAEAAAAEAKAKADAEAAKAAEAAAAAEAAPAE